MDENGFRKMDNYFCYYVVKYITLFPSVNPLLRSKAYVYKHFPDLFSWELRALKNYHH